MNKVSFLCVLLASALAIGTVSANTGDLPLYDAAVAEGRVISMDAAGLSNPDTLWVPGRYIRGSQSSALYIKGVRWAALDVNAHAYDVETGSIVDPNELLQVLRSHQITN